MLTLTTPKSSKILQGALFEKNSALLETGTFTSSNVAKLLPGKKYRPQVLNMKDQRKCMVHFEDKGIFPKKCTGGFWRIQEGSYYQNTILLKKCKKTLLSLLKTTLHPFGIRWTMNDTIVFLLGYIFCAPINFSSLGASHYTNINLMITKILCVS